MPQKTRRTIAKYAITIGIVVVALAVFNGTVGIYTDWLWFASLGKLRILQTQVGTQISLDLKVIDVSAAKPPFSIFSAEEDMDKLADAVERASLSIFNQIMGVVQIDSIRVRGNRRVESEAILAVIGSQTGDQLDYDRLDKDLRSDLLGYHLAVQRSRAALGSRHTTL